MICWRAQNIQNTHISGLHVFLITSLRGITIYPACLFEITFLLLILSWGYSLQCFAKSRSEGRRNKHQCKRDTSHMDCLRPPLAPTRGRERTWNLDMCTWLGMESSTLQWAGSRSNHWTHQPGQNYLKFFKCAHDSSRIRRENSAFLWSFQMMMMLDYKPMFWTPKVNNT